MGILPTPATSKEATASDIVNTIKSLNLSMYNQRVSFVKRTFDLVWNNRQFTAKEIVDAMGTDAVAMFTAHSDEQTALATIAQANGLTYTVLQPQFSVTLNQDGTVTVDMNTPFTP